jgi:hypothetical protein
MNKGVKRSNTGYKGLADISNNQGARYRCGHIAILGLCL